MRSPPRFTESIALLPFVMVLFTVLIVSHELANGVVSGKYFWFYGWIGLSVVAATGLFLVKRHALRFSYLDVCVALFWIAVITSHLVNTQEINTRFTLFLLLGILYVLYRIALTQQKYFQYFISISILVLGLIEAVWGLGQLYGFTSSQHNLFKTTGSFFNPGPYAGYIAMIASMAFYFLIRDYKILNHKYSRKYLFFYLRWGLALLAFTSISIVLPATMSRASWLACIGGCGVVGIVLYRHKFLNIRKKRLLIVLAGIVVGIFGLAGIYNLKKDSADGRALIWKISMRAIIDRPAGVGLGRFAGIYGLYQSAYFQSDEASEQEKNVAECPDYAFNEYLQTGVESGVAALILFPVMLGAATMSLYRKRKIAELGMIVSLMIFAAMSYPLNVLPFPILLVYILASGADGTPGRESLKSTTVLLTISVVLTAMLIYNRYPTYHAYMSWGKLSRIHTLGIPDLVDDYMKLAPLLDDDKQFLFEYAQALNRSGRYAESNRVIEKALRISRDPMFLNMMGRNHQALGEYPEAGNYFIQSSYMVPNRLYPHYLLAKMYAEKGDTLKAVEKAKFVLDIEPKISSPATEEMKAEMGKIINP